MKKFMWLISMCLAGLGGYYLGQQPSSPQVFDWMGRQVEQFQQSSSGQWVNEKVGQGRQDVSEFLAGSKGDSAPTAEPDAMAAEPTYVAENDADTIPRCW